MFHPDFFPTPYNVIELMTEGITIKDKIILEPSAGKGNIVDFLLNHNAKDVLACESSTDLQKILQTKCKLVGSDFLELKGDAVSHIDLIIMNPPFSNADKHILHAYSIAPPGCKIVALCNANTLENTYSSTRKELKSIIDTYGTFEVLGSVFVTSERETGVNVAMIRIDKAGSSYESEFEGFYMEEEPEEKGTEGIMSYNLVRDLVNRYVGSIKIFDEQLDAAVRMNALTSGFYSTQMGMEVTEEGKPVKRAEFKKEMQKSGWKWIFEKMNMGKHTTQGLKEDINKFVEKQTSVPFTMRNIYKMLEIVIGTTSQRMDKALLEVFDKVTKHHSDNQYNVEGWKTNSHYLLTKRFIFPYLIETGWSGEVSVRHSGNVELIDDLVKAVCYLTGDNYSDMIGLYDYVRYKYFLKKGDKYVNYPAYKHDVKIRWSKNETPILDHDKYPGCEIEQNDIQWGQWFEWGYFRCRAYKKGTIHFEFKDEELWGRFNQRIAKLKGYPLFEHKPNKTNTTTPKYKQEAPKQSQGASLSTPVILGTFKIKTA